MVVEEHPIQASLDTRFAPLAVQRGQSSLEAWAFEVAAPELISCCLVSHCRCREVYLDSRDPRVLQSPETSLS